MMTSWEYIYYGNKMTSQATMRIYPPPKKRKERRERGWMNRQMINEERLMNNVFAN